jgi:hypothetical protein
MSSRLRMPPEYAFTGLFAASLSPKTLQQLVRTGRDQLRAQLRQPSDQPEILPAGQLLIYRRELASQPDVKPDPLWLPDHISTQDGRPAAGRLQHGGQDPDHRRLPGPVRAQEPEDGPCLDGEGDTAQCDEVPVVFRQALDDDRIRHEASPLTVIMIMPQPGREMASLGGA